MRLARVCFVLLLAALPLAAQKKPFSVEKLLSLQRISDPQVSPDAGTVLFTVVSPDVAGNTRPSQIWSVAIDGSAPRQVTKEGTRNQRARWSPDGKLIAWVSNRGGAQQIWVMEADGAKPRQLTEAPAEADGVLWAPDGRHLLFTSEVYLDCPDMACNKRREDERAQSPVKAEIFTRLLYRHWAGYKHNKRSHLFIIPAEGGTPLDLTPGDYDVPPFSLGGPDEYTFSPDSREVAYSSNVEPFEASSTNNDIFVVPAGGGPAKKITPNPAWDGTPAYSPDGRYVAYRAQTRPGYESDRFQLMLYDRQTGNRKSLTEKWDRSVQSLFWSPDSSRIYFGAESEGTHPIMIIRASGGEPLAAITGATNDEALITADGSTLVFTRSSIERPAEIFRAATGVTTPNPQPITRINEALLAETHTSPPEPISFPAADGVTIHGWLMKPPNFNPSLRYPVMFLIHGGPQSAWVDGWSYRWNVQTFAGGGYVLAMINPRGSTGYGQKFTDEINADWGGKVYDDIMRGVAYFERLPFVDKTRFGASGASYGGYMVDWIAGHTDRFRCLVTHDGVFDLTSMYGSTEELWFPEWEFRGTPWDNPELYQKWSPSTYVKNFKTPTLVVHGQLDYRVDVSQGFEMFTALQKMKVPSKMLYFPDEGHWVLKPANSALWYREVMGWWYQWMK